MSEFFAFQRYCAPASLQELLQILRDEGPEARVLAGGTDVLVAMKEKGLKTTILVDIKRIAELRGIESRGGLSIGATTSLHEVEISQAVKRACPVLSDAVGQIGSLQVRNRGTLGGNLSNASPAADATPALIVSDAEFELVSATGSRVILAESFFVGPGQSVLRQGEILRRIIVPKGQPGSQSVYLKFGPRQAMDIAVVGLAVSLRFDEDGKCRDARVAMASVAPIPLRAKQVEAALIGEVTEQRIKEAAAQAALEAKPIDDLRGGAKYRKHLVSALLKRAVAQALAQHRAAN